MIDKGWIWGGGEWSTLHETPFWTYRKTLSKTTINFKRTARLQSRFKTRPLQNESLKNYHLSQRDRLQENPTLCRSGNETPAIIYIRRQSLYVTASSAELRNGYFQDRDFDKTCNSALVEISFVFINYSSNIVFKKKKLTLKIDSVASSGGYVKVTYFMCFSLPPLEAGLSISAFFLLYTRSLQSADLQKKLTSMKHQ
jgi:hypothetical protein